MLTENVFHFLLFLSGGVPQCASSEPDSRMRLLGLDTYPS